MLKTETSVSDILFYFQIMKVQSFQPKVLSDRKIETWKGIWNTGTYS